MKKPLLFICLTILAAAVQQGCTHLQSGISPKVSRSERWVILPFQNLAETPRAGERVESILHSILKNEEVMQLSLYPKDNTENLALFINDDKRLAAAKEWAKENDFRYAITGSVQEWRYKTGLDGEPAVGITLNLIDLQNKDTLLWTATASRTGWGAENLTRTTVKVLNAMIGEIGLVP